MKKKLHRHYMKKEIEYNTRKVELTENMKEDIQDFKDIMRG